MADWLPPILRDKRGLTRYEAPRGVELLFVSGLALAGGYLFGRAELTAVASARFIACAVLFLFAVIDLRYRLILNGMIYPAILILLAAQLLLSPSAWPFILLGGIFAFFIFYLTMRLRPGDLGGGDVKLALFIGLLHGFPTVLWALLMGVGGGALTAMVLLLLGRLSPGGGNWGRKTHMPYAPFLCFGAAIALLFNPLPLIFTL